jgi:hypothetical protein
MDVTLSDLAESALKDIDAIVSEKPEMQRVSMKGVSRILRIREENKNPIRGYRA